jgi:hypothetical protein
MMRIMKWMATMIEKFLLTTPSGGENLLDKQGPSSYPPAKEKQFLTKHKERKIYVQFKTARR